jgi:hypothetical protein
MKSGFPPAVLPVEKRLAYYEALDQAHVDHDYSHFIALISSCAKEGFSPYWHVLGTPRGLR